MTKNPWGESKTRKQWIKDIKKTHEVILGTSFLEKKMKDYDKIAESLIKQVDATILHELTRELIGSIIKQHFLMKKIEARWAEEDKEK